jgi:hypothetical protein
MHLTFDDVAVLCPGVTADSEGATFCPALRENGKNLEKSYYV